MAMQSRYRFAHFELLALSDNYSSMGMRRRWVPARSTCWWRS
jgi:hypothetical protein